MLTFTLQLHRLACPRDQFKSALGKPIVTHLTSHHCGLMKIDCIHFFMPALLDNTWQEVAVSIMGWNQDPKKGTQLRRKKSLSPISGWTTHLMLRTTNNPSWEKYTPKSWCKITSCRKYLKAIQSTQMNKMKLFYFLHTKNKKALFVHI